MGGSGDGCFAACGARSGGGGGVNNSLKDAGTYTLIQIAALVFLLPFLQAVIEAIYWLFTGNLFNYSLSDLLGLEGLNQVTTMIGLNKIISLVVNTWITIPPFLFL